MKNLLIHKVNSRLKIRVYGKNIERFIKRLITHQIDLLKIKYPKKDTVVIEVYATELEKIEKLKTVYEIDIIGSYGILSVKKKIRFYKELLISLVVGFIFLLFLTHTIFKIEIIHTDTKVREFLKQELTEHGMKEHSLRKSFDAIEKIKKDILNENRETIEWLEIENVGTSYIIRVEMRKMPEVKEETEPRHLVAKKNAIITRVIAKNGTIVRNKNDYVKKGDVIISGEILLNEEVKNTVSADGTVYGEVWYQTKVEYPLNYKEVKYSGRIKNVYAFRFLNHTFEFTLHPFRQKEYKERKVLASPAFPIGIVHQKQKEVTKVDTVYTEKEALKRAMALGKKQMESQLSDNEYIISTKKLKVEVKESKIVVDIFFTVCEDITEYQKIEPKAEEVPQE